MRYDQVNAMLLNDFPWLLAAQEILTTFLAWRPFGPSTTSKLTRSPSLRVLKAKGDYPAKFEALRRVADSPTRLSTGVLIDALRDENLRYSRLVWSTLRRITGQELGFDPEAWERWWSSGPQPFRP